jgi:hypothetical protein
MLREMQSWDAPISFNVCRDSLRRSSCIRWLLMHTIKQAKPAIICAAAKNHARKPASVTNLSFMTA